MEQTARHPEGRYTIVRMLGSGVYGRVFECKDEADNAKVAVKAVRAEAVYREAAKREILALQQVGVHDNVCRMLRYFDFQGHICVVQELISGGTLYDDLQQHGGYSLYFTQGITKQLLAGLGHIHKCDVLHTDIKTDNIMIDGHSSDGTPLIKIVDLGSAIMGSMRHPNMIGTKEYRSPEAVLQAGWSSAADVWALGCCIFEVYTGQRLFEFDYEITQLYMMERVLGTKMPGRLVRRGVMNRNKHNTYLLCTDTCALARPVGVEVNKIYAAKPLREEIGDRNLRSLLQLMLAMDPEERPSAKALAGHAFCVEELKALPPKKLADEELSDCSTRDCNGESSHRSSFDLCGGSDTPAEDYAGISNSLEEMVLKEKVLEVK